MTHRFVQRAFEARYFLKLLNAMLQRSGSSIIEKPARTRPPVSCFALASSNSRRSLISLYIPCLLIFPKHSHFKCHYWNERRAAGLQHSSVQHDWTSCRRFASSLQVVSAEDETEAEVSCRAPWSKRVSWWSTMTMRLSQLLTSPSIILLGKVLKLFSGSFNWVLAKISLIWLASTTLTSAMS